MHHDDLARLLRKQDGVVARWQLEGITRPHDLERLLRRRELTRLLPGVFVDHTGTPTWRQRAWAGVLALWPAALDLDSALVDPNSGAGRPGPIQLAVDHSRRVAEPDGYRVRRVLRLDGRVRWNAAPPRTRLEVAAIDLGGLAGDDLAAVEVLARVCRDRRTTPGRLAEELAGRARHPRRAWLTAVLDDLASGTCSVLERGYLDLVERPHGLPVDARQREAIRTDGRRQLRDVDYDPLAVVVELDGRMFHDGPGQRSRDLERDLDAALEGRRTVRLGWSQVFDRSCVTAGKVGTLLMASGWPGPVRACRPGCSAVRTAA
ncbi:hypothetical protein [Nocardioides sp. SYSU DS0663]|uniref:hypothetical protein n=1 Tax=Nocardioides sp. SYSU DS0663 TaxID=3416445 RepID=UPI003F4B1734